MFSDQGPTLRELAVQGLSSVERGYDLLAPKFDATPFRTPDAVLDAVTGVLGPLGPFTAGLDLCCGTGAGLGVLRSLCSGRAVGVDRSAGMLAVARAAAGAGGEGPDGGGSGGSGGTGGDAGGGTEGGPGRRSGPDGAARGGPAVDLVRAEALRLPFTGAFDLAVSFGAFGHFLPVERPTLFRQVHTALAPGGLFAFPIAAPPRVATPAYWALLGFDTAMRVRNLVRRPRFVMYYRTFPLAGVTEDLARAGFTVETAALEELGRRPDGSPRCRLVLARRGTGETERKR
ncbi:class I SAM-dependent methyltransferase [Streptomyces zingiberis]|uniref:Methyltransferase domain-containing protein n=1 Tax=Streptomyces zingiberis TaxID=2053010 RepID=A0ABX1BRQ5_9ACTN|nr:class I SAM-dependent methyltransferase [Streptomyces zingiberis]NJQ00407.1 methyltransferase domain-containing protein [Streptomyces zingiberis]